jgi:hypothetical protein
MMFKSFVHPVAAVASGLTTVADDYPRKVLQRVLPVCRWFTEAADLATLERHCDGVRLDITARA